LLRQEVRIALFLAGRCSHAAAGRFGLGAGADDQQVVDSVSFCSVALNSCSFIKDGKIVPVQVTVSLLTKAIFSSPSWNFLIDGFPRNMDNFNGWFDAVGDECDVRGSALSRLLRVVTVLVQVPFALHFTCPQSVMEQRLRLRQATRTTSSALHRNHCSLRPANAY
jgi:hypothetical protein